MDIRPATPQDKPAIIELLKQSLGESTIPKSTSLWTWKHEDNPFGTSFVLVAEENGMLIGVRAFMQWKWQWNTNTYRAIRAVDTATHPQHQGKGIFKKLTLQQLELCKQQGVHFVFNTPNEQSRPGYLKMGWVQQGKMPLKVYIRQPFAMAFARFFNKNRFGDTGEDPSPQQHWPAEVYDLLKHYVQHTDQLATILSPQYIAWRYGNNPLFRYNYFTDNENFLLISRVKNHSFTKELRLVDFMLLNPSVNKRQLSAAIKKTIRRFCKENKIGITSFSGQQFQRYAAYFNWMGIVPVKDFGPIITVRDLNMNDRFNDLLVADNWCYSLGDLELF